MYMYIYVCILLYVQCCQLAQFCQESDYIRHIPNKNNAQLSDLKYIRLKYSYLEYCKLVQVPIYITGAGGCPLTKKQLMP